MTLPIQISFRNIEHSDRIEAQIRKEAAKLDQFYSPITTCRVVVEAPEHRRRYGRQHQVRIDLAVPGGEIVVKNEPALHHSIHENEAKTSKELDVATAYKRVDVAIRDAFRIARRQLQGYGQRQRHEVKVHERNGGDL